MPSMKLTRLTNQTPTRSTHSRSAQSGSAGTRRTSAGSVITIRPTARHCTRRRGAGEQAAHVVQQADQRQQRRASGQRRQWRESALRQRSAHASDKPCGGERRQDHAEAAALRRRLAMQRSVDGARERVGLEPRQQQHQRAGAECCRKNGNAGDDRPVRHVRPAGLPA